MIHYSICIYIYIQMIRIFKSQTLLQNSDHKQHQCLGPAELHRFIDTYQYRIVTYFCVNTLNLKTVALPCWPETFFLASRDTLPVPHCHPASFLVYWFCNLFKSGKGPSRNFMTSGLCGISDGYTMLSY